MFTFFLSPLFAALIVPPIILFVKGVKAGGTRRRVAIYIAVTIACIILAAGFKIYYANEYSSSDKGHYLGSVVNVNANERRTEPKFVWDVKGTDEYIYVLYAYDGTFYKKAD